MKTNTIEKQHLTGVTMERASSNKPHINSELLAESQQQQLSKPRTPRLNREHLDKLSKIREDLQKGRADQQQQPTGNSSSSLSSQLTVKRAGDSRLELNEYELWAKVAKKLLESTLRKALLNMNIVNNKKQLQGGRNGNFGVTEFLDPNEKSLFAAAVAGKFNSPSAKLSASSSLKRSSDIKINLSKMLDKRSLEVLANISGAYIHHNCNNVNKHGVVINTNGIFLACILPHPQIYLVTVKFFFYSNLIELPQIFSSYLKSLFCP
jgi:hypothetical protein